MTQFSTPSRRGFCLGLGTALALPRSGLAASFTEITWDDLVAPGVPYSEIIGEGIMDERNDIWKPQYDSNAYAMNETLNGKVIRMPGYIIPLEQQTQGVTSFILVPYVGACIHVPPPPPNQLVIVDSKTPWPNESLWDAVWVTGLLSTRIQSTEVAEVGYHLEASNIEAYSE